MSTTTVVPFTARDARVPPHAVRSAPARSLLSNPLGVVSHWIARARQRAALADIADDKHLLSDIGLTREQALHEAGKAFWR
jgi:uncharacterized protein YjiS (DUF1127 family)